ncbi:MAG: DUF4625 domain-containing protein [Crocinitomicaceae bacterium]|jgi:hypothetical protein|nr:DUF4625 domain-containing protein [Crocinitomicaceae bacterium]
MKIFIPFFVLCAVVFTSCKKEEVDAEKPSISLDKPLENAIVNLGNSFDFQGVVYDNTALSSLQIRIVSPDASYDYHYLDSINVTGESSEFHDWITIPINAAVGVAEFKVYARDASGNESGYITRIIQIRDKIDPVIVTNPSLIEDNDSIIFTLYKNEYDIFDSLTVYNFTKFTNLATYTDIGGFRDLIITRAADTGWEVNQFELHDLTTVTAPVHTVGFTIDLDESYPEYYLHPPFLRVTVVEYRTPIDLNVYSSQADNGHHSVEFDVTP